jgi:hypothetical protein
METWWFLPEIVEVALNAVVPQMTKALAKLVAAYLAHPPSFRGEIIHRIPRAADKPLHTCLRLAGTLALTTKTPTSNTLTVRPLADITNLDGHHPMYDMTVSRDGTHGWHKPLGTSLTAVCFDPPLLNASGSSSVVLRETASIDTTSTIAIDRAHGVPFGIRVSGRWQTLWEKLNPTTLVCEARGKLPLTVAPWHSVIAGTLYTVSYSDEVVADGRRQMIAIPFPGREIYVLQCANSDEHKLDILHELVVQYVDSRTMRLSLWFGDAIRFLEFDVDSTTGLPRNAVRVPDQDREIDGLPLKVLRLTEHSKETIPGFDIPESNDFGFSPNIYGQYPLVFSRPTELVFAV